MQGFFTPDGALMGFLNKAGQLIILSILWLIFSLPVFTAGASTAALFYAVTKSVRRGRGYPGREFLRAFRKNLLKGSVLFLLLALAGLLPGYLFVGAVTGQIPLPDGGAGICVVLLLMIFSVAVYVFPVISRFEEGAGAALRRSVLMSVRFFHLTLLLEAECLLLLWAQIFLLPAACILFLPGAVMYPASFLLEKAMRPYYPDDVPDGTDAWWLE